jgi:hypothetical protein
MAENSTYTLTKKPNQGQSMIQTGKVVFDATAITAADYIEIDVGFKPSYVNFTNITDRITVEHFEGMTDDTCVKSAAAGTRTLETTNKGITLTDTGFRVAQNATLAVIAASKTCHYLAEA